jgi:polyadenylate-binding protein
MADRVFVGNLPHDTTEEIVKAHIAAFSPVLSVKIARDAKGRSRCFAFVDVESSDAALTGANGSMLGGRPLKISKAWEQPGRFQPSGDRDRERGGRRSYRDRDR